MLVRAARAWQRALPVAQPPTTSAPPAIASGLAAAVDTAGGEPAITRGDDGARAAARAAWRADEAAALQSRPHSTRGRTLNVGGEARQSSPPSLSIPSFHSCIVHARCGLRQWCLQTIQLLPSRCHAVRRPPRRPCRCSPTLDRSPPLPRRALTRLQRQRGARRGASRQRPRVPGLMTCRCRERHGERAGRLNDGEYGGGREMSGLVSCG